MNHFHKSHLFVRDGRSATSTSRFLQMSGVCFPLFLSVFLAMSGCPQYVLAISECP